MMGRVSCADLAELRSAFLDDALREADRERVLVHLAGCESCRTEVADMRRLRQLLALRKPAPSSPGDLSERLLAIPVRNRPRALDRIAPGVRGLPGGLVKIRRRVTALVVAVGLGAVAAGGLGLAAAPAQALTAVSDPNTEAVAEFADVLAQLPFTNQHAGALVGVSGANLAALPDGRPSADAAGAALPPANLVALLARVAQADSRFSYSGEQDYFATRDGQRVSAALNVVNEPDQGTQVTAYDRAGREIGEHFYRAATLGRLTDTATVSLLTDSYDLVARSDARALGREAVLVEARTKGPATGVPAATSGSGGSAVLARWWVDAATGLLLWQETYDGDGELALSTGFTRLTIGPIGRASLPEADASRTSASRIAASLTVSRADDLASAGWACSDQLAGLSLVRLRSDAVANPGVVHMVYSDGVTTVSVVEQHGRLDASADARWDPALGAYVRQGSTTSAAWQSGESVVTVVTDGSGELLQDVVGALPHEPLRSASTMERVVAGWTRILGHR